MSRAEAYAALGPRGAFAAPDIADDAPYVDSPSGAWSPTPRTSVSGYPDAHRLGVTPVRDFKPSPTDPPEIFYNARDRDTAARHSVETVDADGWTEHKGGSGKPYARNAEANRPPETRPTMAMAPRSYFFTRPMGPKFSRDFNGEHFSMADHRREYEILGMAPVRSSRNTFRLEPKPWDTNIVDMPTESTIPNGKVIAVEVPPATGNRSYRL